MKNKKIRMLNLSEMKEKHGNMEQFNIYVEKHYLKEYPEHSHSFCEMEIIIKGEAIHILNGNEYILRHGDIILTNPTTVHGWKRRNDNNIHVITVAFEYDIFLGQFDFFNSDSLIMKANDEIQRKFHELLEEKNKNDEYTNRVMRNIVEYILLYLSRNSNKLKIDNKDLNIEYALGYIHKNFMENITIEEISRMCNYSVSHFSKKFKKVTGKTFVRYLNDVRLSYAENILERGEWVITELAYDSGFGSVRNFNREFRKKYGCSPGEYKKRRNAGE